jgi:predicted acyltransferase
MASVAVAEERATRSTAVPSVSAERLQSLDVFRGITIAGMLLVNNPGSWSTIYAPLRHAEWHGWTPTDLIFPFFLFIVGTSMALSFSKRQAQGAETRDLLFKAVKRALLIFLVGIALHSFPWIGYDFGGLRIPGVLQRIALVYLIASVIYLTLPSFKARVVVLAVLLFGYWALQTLVTVPGGTTSLLEPGKDFGSWIDRAVFTPAHIWRSTGGQWDPEGLLSSMPAVGTTLLGIFVGQLLLSQRTATEKALQLFLYGFAGMMVGAVWGWFFPINKPLWTSSYVIFTAGIGCQLLALCYYLVDMRGYRRWAKPFVVFGMNAIAAFALSGLGARVLSMIHVGADNVTLKSWIYQNAFLSWATPINASLAFALSYVLVWLAIMWVFYQRKIFIKL